MTGRRERTAASGSAFARELLRATAIRKPRWTRSKANPRSCRARAVPRSWPGAVLGVRGVRSECGDQCGSPAAE